MVPRYNSIVILTGAGISAESGIKTFRASDGLWESHRIEDVASARGFAVDPELVHRFYNMRRRQLVSPTIRHNEGHEALARLQESFPGQVFIVTQNIDNLHKRAGSENIIHMHGELLKMRCSASGKIYPIRGDIGILDRCDCCGSAGTLRPHVVWYGEKPLAMERIYHALESCDLFLSIGTSGNVYPAAGFVRVARSGGAHSVELNLEPSEVESAFAEKIYGPATRVVPAFVDRILEVASVA